MRQLIKSPDRFIGREGKKSQQPRPTGKNLFITGLKKKGFEDSLNRRKGNFKDALFCSYRSMTVFNH